MKADRKFFMENEFKNFLEKEEKATYKGKKKLTQGAINSRLSRAARIERELNISLEEATKNKESLKDLKKLLKEEYTKNVSAALYNTATRYFKFKHGVEPEKEYRSFLRV